MLAVVIFSTDVNPTGASFLNGHYTFMIFMDV